MKQSNGIKTISIGGIHFDNMVILVIGNSGQLGFTLSKNCNNIDEIKSINSRELDLLSIKDILSKTKAFSPSAIINTVAWTDVDRAEIEKVQAHEVNVKYPENLAYVAREMGVPFYHISTDYVFSGIRKKPWELSDLKNPLNEYGKTKSMGEDVASKVYPEGTRIFRTAWLYSPYRNNFVKTIIKVALRDESEIFVVDDQYGQPTSASDLAERLLLSLNKSIPAGIYHATNSGVASRKEFAQEILKLLGEDSSRIKGQSSERTNRIAERPLYSVLSEQCWAKVGMKPLRNWRLALEPIVREIRSANDFRKT